MLIQVKQEHIDNGLCSNPFKCPVALALKEYFKTDFVEVRSPSTRSMKVDDIQYIYPETVALFIRQFDGKNKVEPFSFETHPINNMIEAHG